MNAPTSRYRLVPMWPRDPDEAGRTASSLELFFDLVFVVAVSIASVQLHHQLTEAHVLDGILNYAVVFFGIWWAWMNFTWFATSFDTDDWLYRLLTIVQMGGVLVLASGIQAAFEDQDYVVLILAYVVMRVALVAQWMRASRSSGDTRRSTTTYAIGIAVVQLLWLASLLLPAAAFWPAVIVLIGAELAVPVAAERRARTPWHPHHLSERFGLFSLILLGESLLASANAIIEALHEGDTLGPLIRVAVLTLVVTAALWWVYFWAPHHTAIDGLGLSLGYGYGHYFIFAAAGALSAGIEAEVDVITGHSELDPVVASFAYTVPIAVFVLGIWLLVMRRSAGRHINVIVPAGAVLVLIDPLIPIPFALTAVILTGVVAALIWQKPLDLTPQAQPAARTTSTSR
ncbi:low temperature requirement protein A [Actinoplanes solisilvae]|uniref:low temperature requirement protein A n=1 Tax=Actinoplanes solisilvae TaxID=2486853 RepID=UPI000FDAC663|nr:low temperature requirement protein A [Actinoplanes solisilvae]